MGLPMLLDLLHLVTLDRLLAPEFYQCLFDIIILLSFGYFSSLNSKTRTCSFDSFTWLEIDHRKNPIGAQAIILQQQKTFSHYLKVETIASGGSGEVCKVTRKSPDGEIVRAVKLLDLAEDNAPFAFYTQEIRILRALLDQQIYYGRSDEDEEAEEKHHGLIHVVRLSPQAKFIGVCAKRYLYIVMEYYPGSLVAFQGHVAQDELALRFIISQVTHGLNFLHSIGIIHMDLKTHNIFVSRTGHTWAGAYTPGFVAPEARIKLPQSVTPLCDFWSLGVTIYVLVVDHDQFGQEETHVQLGLVAMKMAERMEIYGCPREIWYIVNGMCQSRPKDRWGGQKILDYLRRNFDYPAPCRRLRHY
ncbi:kinase-like domain-containing protein [Gymnopilus junonius]|uniref:Kinase-like domain-containing protein n=1 Tax=Gymnopilus junonius TaxID=109634 RepID=A0A9P5NN05_GYMJU|nr:kinase-like domain-containing protein [Gymnopilus junonius]